MSIDIDWERATAGADGEQLAERIRGFVHEKFQKMPLPGFIRSVDVTSFSFGNVAPEFEILNLSDPFEDFYEEDDEDDDEEDDIDEVAWDGHGREKEFGSDSACAAGVESRPKSMHTSERRLSEDNNSIDPLSPLSGNFNSTRPSTSPGGIGSPSLNIYPPIQLGDHFLLPHHEPAHMPRTSGVGIHKMSVASSPLAASVANPFTRSTYVPPISMPRDWSDRSTANQDMDNPSDHEPLANSPGHQRRMRERKAEDLQVFCRVKYSGNIRLSLTAVILLDYPMPSFVGLPLKLNICGMSFDGVAVLAYIRKRVHFCFLSPEDEAVFLPKDSDRDSSSTGESEKQHYSSSNVTNQRDSSSSVLQKIRVESEIGRKEDGKQMLKNVGKVEKFVLEQVRRIFDEEFIYPSFWTFLV